MSQKLYRQVFENNKRWIESKTKEDKVYFEEMAKGQAPEFLYIGCSDSRVPANAVMGLEPGQMFVHRNIANVVPISDVNVHSVIQYAVEHLKVQHVVVCGHYGCGGVKAAMSSQDLGGELNMWLRNIRDVYRLHKDELNAIKDEDERYKRLVELNVQEQCINVFKSPFVQKSIANNQSLSIHGWVYDLKNGAIKDLDIDFDATIKDIKDIYHIS